MLSRQVIKKKPRSGRMDPATYKITKGAIEQSYESFTEVLGRLAC